MADQLRAVVIGASSGVGRAIAEGLAAAGASLVIASRDATDLEKLAFHLRLTTSTSVRPTAFDLRCSPSEAKEFCSSCVENLGSVDALFLAAAQVSDEDCRLTPGDVAENLICVDLLGPIHVLTAFARVLEIQRNGTIVVFSSVAAPVPRRNNVVYSSSKMGLEGFCRGIRHHLVKFGVRVQIYRLGYVDTSMAAGRSRLLPKAKPEAVAHHVIRRLRKDFGLAYYPRYWRSIIFALQRIPWFLYRRLEF